MEPLIDAVLQGNSLLVRELIQQGNHPDTRDDHQETGLTWAAHLGHTAVVKDLLAAGADQEAVGNFLRATPLILASRGGHRGIVALLAVFSNLNARDHRGATALMLAVEQQAGLLKPPHRVVAILETLINAGADVNLQDHQGNTALIWAILWGHRDAIRLLISANADHTLKNFEGQAAIDIAAQHGYIDIVKMLQQTDMTE